MNKTKKTLLLFASVLMIGISFTACDKDDDNDDNQAAIIEMRDNILAAAEAARTACDHDDNTAEIRASLNTMVEELVALAPQRTESEKASEVAGGWLQIWSDNPFTTVDNICFDTDHIYQIVSLDGYYYNISQVDAFGSSLGYFIRGIYESQEDALPVEFTDAYFSMAPLVSGTDLLDLVQTAENGEIVPAQIPPTPVVGITGTLGNIYVDEELRIITDGSSAVANSSDLYIMRRQAAVQ